MKKIYAIFGLIIGLLSTGCQHQQTALIHSYTPNSSYKQNLKKVVLIGGCFDILHYGHIQFLQKAREHGDFLIVALEPDGKIIKQKHRIPIHTQRTRAQNLASLRCVDEVLLLPNLSSYEDYLTLVERIRPTIIAVTQGDPQLHNKLKQAHTIDAKVVVVTERLSNLSSSLLMEKCAEH